MPDKYSKIRHDLVIQEIKKDDGSIVFVIKDPLTNAFFQVREPEYFIISRFDGQSSPETIASAFKEKFDLDIDAPTIEGFATELQKLCFLDNDLTRQELLKKQYEQSREKKKTLFGRITFVKLKAINPGPLFNRLIEYTRPFFKPWFVWLASVAVLFSIVIAIGNGGEIARGIGALWSLQGLVIIYLSMIVVVIFHEFAHGLTCRYFGGEVREIGFLLLYFQPAFYCNVSDTWLFPEKRKRLLVTFAGAFMQVFIWALAVMVWRAVAADTLISRVALAVMVFSGVATLFNFNPLMRYDGYYLLSDYLDIPNLRLKAARYWRGKLKAVFLNVKDEFDRMSRRERKIFFYYGIFSFLYITLILGYLFLKLEQFLVDRLGAAGLVIFIAAIGLLFRNFIVESVKGMAAFFKRKGPLLVTFGIIVIIVLVSVFVRWELRVKGEVHLHPMNSLLVKYSRAGYVELVKHSAASRNPGKQREVSAFTGDYTTSSLLPLKAIGDTVVAGDVIARLSNSETVRLISDYAAQLEKAREELALLERGARDEEIDYARNNVRALEAQLTTSVQNLARHNEMLGKELIARQAWEMAYSDSVIQASKLKAARNALQILLDGARPEEIKAKKAEITSLESRIDFHRNQLEQYEIKSSIDGIVISVDTGEVVLEIVATDTMNAAITLSERDLADIKSGQTVKFMVRGYPGQSFYGEIFNIDNKVIPDKNESPVFRVDCRVANTGHRLRPGMTGTAIVYCGKRTVGHLLYRKFFRTIRTEFWDWFDWI